MQSITTYLFRVAVLGAVAALAACASTPETSADTTQKMRAAETTLANFAKDPEMTWFRNNLKNARAIVISPRITRAGFVVGGSGGESLVLARDGSGGWTGPAFYNMYAGSIGLQAGADVSEVIVLVMTQKALDSLLSSSFKMGADGSISAGPVGVGAASNIKTDMVSFSRSKGVYAGLNLDGASLSPDTGANGAFYGRPVSPVDILVTHSVSKPPAASSLQQSLVQLSK